MRQLTDFAGRWRLSRTIEDHRAGTLGRLEGYTNFTPHPQGLLYVEQGQLLLPGQPEMTARRSYIWCAGESGAIAVAFEDGRPFHRFGSVAGLSDVHHCDPDTYRVGYDFSDWPDWRTVWNVTGPRKDYRMVSQYRRQSASRKV